MRPLLLSYNSYIFSYVRTISHLLNHVNERYELSFAENGTRIEPTP